MRIMKRLFLAIKINPGDNFLSFYYQLLKQFKDEKINWVPPENMHLTLKFFGETPEEKISAINQVARTVVQKHKAFQFDLKDIGIFGSAYKPRVIWFDAENTDPIIDLARDLLHQLKTIGFQNDRQNFVPHLTVGRIKKIRDVRSFQEKLDKYKGSFIQKNTVSELILFESKLTHAGAIYEAIERFRLQ